MGKSKLMLVRLPFSRLVPSRFPFQVRPLSGRWRRFWCRLSWRRWWVMVGTDLSFDRNPLLTISTLLLHPRGIAVWRPADSRWCSPVVFWCPRWQGCPWICSCILVPWAVVVAPSFLRWIPSILRLAPPLFCTTRWGNSHPAPKRSRRCSAESFWFSAQVLWW